MVMEYNGVKLDSGIAIATAFAEYFSSVYNKYKAEPSVESVTAAPCLAGVSCLALPHISEHDVLEAIKSTNLLNFTGYISSVLDSGARTDSLFLDLAKAFDKLLGLFGFGNLELRRKVASLMFLYKLVRGVVDDPTSLAVLSYREQRSVLGSNLPHDGSRILAALPGDVVVQFYTELRNDPLTTDFHVIIPAVGRGKATPNILTSCDVIREELHLVEVSPEMKHRPKFRRYRVARQPELP
ncbi:hypothetical protein J6590_074319 [Homalodisca vitripennis]|nr:hypothetical protein J6590_074319 [Homalodisca vitripennis]